MLDALTETDRQKDKTDRRLKMSKAGQHNTNITTRVKVLVYTNTHTYTQMHSAKISALVIEVWGN